MPRKRLVLAALCAAQFVLILDVSVVNVALVPLAADLGAAPGDLQLVATAYAATFGGLLLIGGRLADAGHRRSVFLAGLLLFAAASSLCGAAWSVPVLVTGRALQGVGASLASPAALSLLTTVFGEGRERNRALGTWAAVAAAGGAAGLVAGGVLTESVGWRAVFLVNVPIIVTTVSLALRVIPGDEGPDGPRRLVVSPWSAVTGFGALAVLLAGLSGVEGGWPRSQVIATLTAAAALAMGFVVADRRSSVPLLPGSLVGRRTVLAANMVTLTMSAVVLGVNFFLAVHLQQRLGLSPVQTGLAFVPITVASACTATVSARVVQRVGPRPLLVAGMVSMSLGAMLLARLPDQGSYLWSVLPGMLLVAAGMGPGFAVGSIAATSGVPPEQQGAAAALLSASTQIGAAIGLAGLGVLAGSQGGGGSGARAAFAAMTALALTAAAAAAFLPSRGDPGESGAGPAVHLPAQAAGCLPGYVRAAATVATDSAAPTLPALPRPSL
ncbi:MAG: MFS transporter [Kineosporiaceae bacterium]